MGDTGPNANTGSKRKTFALAIGINNYSSHTSLKGAVGDADRFRDWLVSGYGVPCGNIINLRDEEATGAGIRGALASVVDNEHINPGDNFIFYFSGLGSSADAPASWYMSTNQIQMFLPSDFDANIPTEAKGLWTAEPGRGILDTDLRDIIEDVSARKGGLRILAILDCCFRGAGTQSGADNLTVRGVDLASYKLPESPPSSLTRGSFSTHHRSHIILAACAANEKAYEVGDRGLFTDALLAIFQKPNFQDLTCLDLMRQLEDFPELVEKQTPRCEGFDLHRNLFTLDTSTSFQPPIYAIQEVDRACGSFRLAGGWKHGITNGAHFTVHTDKNCTSAEVAYIVAVNTLPLVTHCSFLPDTPETLSSLPHDAALYAVQTLHGHSLQLFIDRDDPHYPRWKMLIDQNVSDISIGSIHLVGPNDEADLAISADGQNVLFEVKNAKCREYGAEYLSWKAVRIDEPDDYLLGILRGAADFFRHLDLPNMSALYKEPFEVRCLELCQQESFFGPWAPKPDASNLCRDHKIYMVEDKNASYGFEITNNSMNLFHAEVFMFNVHNLQISHADKGSLPPGESLRIGFGDSGANPRMFFLPEGQSTDISFLKIFLSSRPHSFSDLDQQAPFTDNACARGDVGPRESVEDFALTIPVIQGDISWLMKMGMPDTL
ncbi:hypothetical protein H0H93_005631 [Arthromyces matolae]|nr:hypothetical protein H0H93_005631 [Arthromyces matolae]